jgi:acyl carrier protein phosphodiesterase
VNYLAHLHLADFTGTSLAGSLMGDVVRGPLRGRYAPDIEIGIRLHRSIDSYTDAHPVVRAAKARFQRPYRRYAGILLDVYFDHCLALAWEHYHSLPLEEFASRAHGQLEKEATELQHPGFALRLSYMRTRNLLLSYRALSGVDYALKGLSTRLTRTNPLASALPVLLQQQTHLKNDFRAFYPQLIQHAQAITQELVT